jgi:hypothetical protein
MVDEVSRTRIFIALLMVTTLTVLALAVIGARKLEELRDE